MAQPVDSQHSEMSDSVGADATSRTDQPGGTSQTQRRPIDSAGTPTFDHVLSDALVLLTHATETGVAVDDATRNSILNATRKASHDWTDPEAGDLLAALATLSAKLRPVTADSLRASCSSLTNPDIKTLRIWTFVLAVPIILFSVLGFLSSSISTAIRSDVTKANELAVKLRAELGTPTAPKGGTPEKPLPEGLNEGDVITDLQAYAATVRAIDARARQLNGFVLSAEHDPYANLRWNSKSTLSLPHASADDIQNKNGTNQDELKKKFQLVPPLSNMPQALEDLTNTYQDVRSFAQDIVDLVSVYYGAITTCLLPILYALLGTCAYLLRNFEEELRLLTFVPSSKTNWARFLIAGIGGAVVGLFNFALTQSASISPLAIAFLVGYAVDVFFSFLEGLLQTFTRSKTSVNSNATTS